MGNSFKVGLAVVALVALGVAAYQLVGWQGRLIEEAREQETTKWRAEVEELEAEIEKLRAAEKEAPQTLEQEEEPVGFSGEAIEFSRVYSGELSCDELNREVVAFFSYLDEKDYVRAHGFGEKAYALFQSSMHELAEQPPLVSGEMGTLSALLKNVAHFDRVLEKERIGLVKDILAAESEVTENAFALVFLWLISGKRCGEDLAVRPSERVLYEYAGFFLDTLAGKAYLLRRDSVVRTLLGYYSVLILDRANERGLNAHGIDIRPYIDRLRDDVSSQSQLKFQPFYLEELYRLKRAYDVRYLPEG